MKDKLLNWAIIIIGLVLIISLTRSIIDLSGRGEIVEKAELRVKKAEEENALLREKYYEVTQDEYVEKVAREKLGLGKEGEVVVVLPNKSKMKNEKEKMKNENKEANKNKRETVWHQWIELFL